MLVYQLLRFFASGMTGFTRTTLLPIVDKETPETDVQEYMSPLHLYHAILIKAYT